ncbi:unnamed protein product [Hymenolepis diminuta]|uniref:TFIIE beta domain-containing protein n=1 Tax=Hymenolepis diminuta TaxID=6216 RepID=A0A0R3SUB2_HYMDI|nr:unnamed protein product [Hymenolepis diminuta]VUZ56128.1 unnamed protein product [Hymenolepis diminuta]
MSNAASYSNADLRDAYLASVDFHRDLILKAIEDIRVDRPSKKGEIMKYLSTRHNIPFSDVDICIRKLADRGEIEAYVYRNCVSYINPKDVRKLGVKLNKPLISEKIAYSIYHLSSKVGGDAANRGFTEDEIKEALLELANNATFPPELEGFKLRESLAVESKYGFLSALPEGRYTLKENFKISLCSVGDQQSLSADSTLKIGDKRELHSKGSQYSTSPSKRSKSSPVSKELVTATASKLKLTEIVSDAEVNESDLCSVKSNVPSVSGYSLETDVEPSIAHTQSLNTNMDENIRLSESSNSEDLEDQPLLISSTNELMEFLLSPLSEEEIMSGKPRWAKDPE